MSSPLVKAARTAPVTGSLRRHVGFGSQAHRIVCAHFNGAKESLRPHRAIDNPGHYSPVSPLNAEPLLRVLSLTSFVTWHISRDGDTGFDAHASAHLVIEEIRAPSTWQLPLDALRGATGRPGEPTWWTFNTAEAPPPADGETYMAELALGSGEHAPAAGDGVVVELRVGADQLGERLYKPSALDAFEPETLFRPELRGDLYGRTVPQGNDLQSRPEVVSRSLPYDQVGSDDTFLTGQTRLYRNGSRAP